MGTLAIEPIHANGKVLDEERQESVIWVAALSKNYRLGDSAVHALRSISLVVQKGEFVAVMGPSGSGKSTFMNVLGCLDRPTSGSHELDGVEVTHLKSADLSTLRCQKPGFIFQGFNLLARMDALENVMLPMVYGRIPGSVRRTRALVALLVGLASRAHHRPNELSGGEQRRVAIARALVHAPSLILADEPTGNLDSGTHSGSRRQAAQMIRTTRCWPAVCRSAWACARRRPCSPAPRTLRINSELQQRCGRPGLLAA